jgi:hypothetical protein
VLGRLTGVLVPEAQTFRALVLFRAVHEVCFAKIGDSRDDDNAKGLLSPGPTPLGPGERVLPGCIIGRVPLLSVGGGAHSAKLAESKTTKKVLGNWVSASKDFYRAQLRFAILQKRRYE